MLASAIVGTPSQHSPQANPFDLLVTQLSNASSSAAADPTTTPDALAPPDALHEASSFAIILGVSAFLVLIGTYPLWRKLLCCLPALPCINDDDDDDSSINNNIPSFLRMDVVSTTGPHPSSDGNEVFWSADVSAHDRTTSGITLGSPRNSYTSSSQSSSHEQSLPFPWRFRREGEPLVQYLSM
jgi:hypothetical protein